MKKFIFISLLISGFLPLQGQQQPGFEQYRQMFWDQIAQTCSMPIRWEKSVEELDASDNSPKQSKVFTIDCHKGTLVEAATGEENVLTTSEFAELFKYRFDDPYLRDNLNVSVENGSVHAKVLSEKAGKIALQEQVFELDPSTRHLRFAEVRVTKSNLLYDFEIHTRVWFDAQGRYMRHTTETFTRVVMSGSVKTVIEGKILS